MKLEYSRQNFEEYANTKFHKSPFSGSRVVSCGLREGETDMTKLIVAYSIFANVP